MELRRPGVWQGGQWETGSPSTGYGPGRISLCQIEICLGDARSLPFRANVADIVFIEDTVELFAEDEMTTVVGELKRILRPDGRLCVVTMERVGAEEDLFVRAYDWLFERVPDRTVWLSPDLHLPNA